MSAVPLRNTDRVGETWLLILSGVATVFGLAGAYLAARPGTVAASTEVRAAVVYSLTIGAIWISFRLGRFKGDTLLYPLVSMLAGIGLVMAVRLEPDLIERRGFLISIGLRQLIYVCVGMVMLWAIAVFLPDPRFLSRYPYTLLFAGIVLLLITAVVGTEVNGARLWLEFGGVQVQSAEIVKVLLVLFLAAYLDSRIDLVGTHWRLGRLRLPPIPYLAPMFIMWAACILALLALNDLGTALLFFALFLIMLFAANGSAGQFAAGVIVFLGGMVLAYLAVPRVAVRVDNWRDPWSDPFGAGYQQIQAEFALSSGGFLGTGIGEGRPWLVPEVQTDYIIAAIGEEAGFLGVAVVITLYGLLTVRGVLIARLADDDYLKLLATGLTSALAIQAFVILAGVFRLLPLTGVTLPFVSYGGSSILVSLVIVGLLLRISAVQPQTGH